MRLALIAPTLLAGLLLAAACVEEESVVTEDIVSTIPWPDDERAEYVLLDRDDGEERGRGVLSVARLDGQFELGVDFAGEVGTDETVVVVDAETLKPTSVRRDRRIEGDTEIIEGEYDAEEGVVEITESSNVGEERLIPLRLEEHYYDNDSSLFLWRTIPFREGYEVRYHTVLTNQRAQKLVTVEVAGREEVTVPAGTFQAWRVEIRSGGVKQVAWYADTPERPLVQYDNSIQLFQLTAPGDSP